MSLYTLRNDFHNTECRVRANGLSHIHNVTRLTLTFAQAKRIRRKLCGIKGCKCAENDCGTRGYQHTDNGKRIELWLGNPWA